MDERDFSLDICESLDIHEQGGLTANHWQEVLKRVGIFTNPITQKLKRYGQLVIAGVFPDTGFHHRDYLGIRHWEAAMPLLAEKYEFTWPWQKNEDKKAKALLRSEARMYMLPEKYQPYTFQDYFYYLEKGLRNLFRNLTDMDIFWDKDKKEWVHDSWVTHEDKSKGGYVGTGSGDTGGWWEPGETTTVHNPKSIGEFATQEILQKWLIDGEQVHNLSHTSPEKLSNLALKIIAASPERFSERMKKNISTIFFWPGPYEWCLKQDEVTTNYGPLRGVSTKQTLTFKNAPNFEHASTFEKRALMINKARRFQENLSWQFYMQVLGLHGLPPLYGKDPFVTGEPKFEKDIPVKN